MVLVGEFQAKKVYLYTEYVPIPIKIKHCPFQGGKNSIKLGEFAGSQGTGSHSGAQSCPLLLARWTLGSGEGRTSQQGRSLLL